MKMDKDLREICKNCGFTLSAHNADSFYSKHLEMYVPYSYCPGKSKGTIDWNKESRITFSPTGTYKEEE